MPDQNQIDIQQMQDLVEGVNGRSFNINPGKDIRILKFSPKILLGEQANAAVPGVKADSMKACRPFRTIHNADIILPDAESTTAGISTSPVDHPVSVESFGHAIRNSSPLTYASSYDIVIHDTVTHDAMGGKMSEEQTPLTPAMFHVLLALTDGDKHGYAILKEVAEQTSGEVQLSTGTLYGIIKRLLVSGWIREVRGPAIKNDDPRRRYYRLTEEGRQVAVREAKRLEKLVDRARSKRLIRRPSTA